MDEYNVFILSAGRRVELIQCFQDAARRLALDSKIIAGDCSVSAPAMYFADKSFVLPPITDPGYLREILNICLSENIALIVPTIDPELLLLSEAKEEIEGTTNAKVLISETSVISICRDKLATHRFLTASGFGVPRLYSREEIVDRELDFPVFIKPRSGSSSINAHKVVNRMQLDAYVNLIPDYMVQEYLEGEEYTVDVFLDFLGNVLTIVPRLRLAVRSGEISKGKIVKDNAIIADVQRLMRVLRPIGHITVQLVKTSHGIKYIEINPRFGGGAPMSIKSGADSCENLFRLQMGQSLQYNENYCDGLTFLRFDNSICLNSAMERVE